MIDTLTPCGFTPTVIAEHQEVGVRYKNCPAAWREVKKRIAEDEEGFIVELKEALAKRVS